MINRKEFSDWLENSVTKRVFEILNREREGKMGYLLDAVPDYQSKENCLMVMGRLIGAINAVDLLLEINYECIQTEEEAEAENNE